MAINIKRGSISDNGTAFRAPASAEINIEDANIDRNAIAFDIFLTPDALSQAGLPSDTPPALIKELIALIQARGTPPTQAATAEALPRSSLWQWIEGKLGAAASLATVGESVWKLVSQFPS